MRLVQNVRDSVCKGNSSFKTANVEAERAFYQELDTVSPGGTDPNYQNRMYKRLADISDVKPFISLDLDGALAEGDFKDFGLDGINSLLNSTMGSSDKDPRAIFYPDHEDDFDGSNNCVPFPNPGDKEAKYYRVYQNSHTIVSVDLQFVGGLDGKFTGTVFASRCVPNDIASQIKEKQPKRAAVWVLNELEYRPYYFPRDATGKGLAFEEAGVDSEIKCCNIPLDPATILK